MPPIGWNKPPPAPLESGSERQTQACNYFFVPFLLILLLILKPKPDGVRV
jgi:hypothetical protein